MPWAEADKESIRRWLGWPVSQRSYQRIMQKQNDVAAVGGEGAIVTTQDILLQIRLINTAINDQRDVAGLADEATSTEDGASDRTFYRGQSLAELREEGRRNVRELAETLGLMIMRDVFAIVSGSSRTYRG